MSAGRKANGAWIGSLRPEVDRLVPAGPAAFQVGGGDRVAEPERVRADGAHLPKVESDGPLGIVEGEPSFG